MYLMSLVKITPVETMMQYYSPFFKGAILFEIFSESFNFSGWQSWNSDSAPQNTKIIIKNISMLIF